MAKYCMNCGAQLLPDAKFCINCGQALTSTPPPVQNAYDGDQHSVNSIHDIIAKLSDNDIKADKTTGEISCVSSEAQNAFLRLLRNGKVLIAVFVCLFTSVSAFADEIKRTVSTGFGTITYTITGVEQQMQSIDNPEGPPDSKTSKKKYGYYRDQNNDMQRDELTQVTQLKVRCNSYRVYQNASGVKISVSFNPGGSNFIKETKYQNIDVQKQFDLVVGSSYKRKTKNEILPQLHITKAPYECDDVSFFPIIDDKGVYIRIGARCVSKYLDGQNYKVETDLYYDEIHLVFAAGKSDPAPEEGSEDEEAFTKPDNNDEEPNDIGPIHEEIDTIPPDEPGESGWLIPTLIGVIALTGGLTAWKKKKEKEKKDTPPRESGKKSKKNKKEDEEDYEERCTYEMRIKKDFGDTFTPGDPPQKVYARIVRHTPDGKSYTDTKLTLMIQITGDDYLQVSPATPIGEYIAADVQAPAIDNVPAEAVVNFTMAAEGASFTNHMHFFIEGAEILFGQDNLTLPTDYEKTVELPFLVLGMGEDVKIEMTVENDAYKAVLKQDKKKGIWFAVLTENKDCADFKKKLEPGNYKCYSLHIKATDANDRKVETDFPICRFQMGLTIDTTYIKCYEEEYAPMNHLSNRFIYDRTMDISPWNSHEPNYVTRKMTPAETKCRLRLFEYDEEKHQVLRIPAVPDEVKFEAVEESRQSLIEKLGIDWEPRKDADNGARLIIFRCIRGALDAPLRIKSKVKISLTFNGHKYNLEKEVMLHSQPVRQSRDMEDSIGQIKEDERIGEKLIYIQSVIFKKGYLKNLAPLDRYIQNMLDSYDAAYGYDNEQLRTVRRIWLGFHDGTFVGANAEAEPVTLGDELMLFFNAFMDKGKEVEDSLGFFSRMALGFVTLGCSEVVFTSMEVVREMKAYVDKGGDSVVGGFCCGVKVVVREYLTEKVTDLGIGAFKKGATKVGLTPENIKAKAKEYYGSISRGRQMKQTISNQKAKVAQAKIEADNVKMLTQNKKLDLDEIKMKQAEVEGLALGKEKIDNYRAAVEMLDDSPVNAKLKKELALEIQQDKNAMSLLENYGDRSLDNTRKKFTAETQRLSHSAEFEVKYEIAQQYGVAISDIKTLNASASSKEAMRKGRKITFDHDTTFYYENPKTKEVWYFNQKQTEELYNRKYFEAAKDFEAAEQSFANRFAKKADQTVVQSDFHPESYGTDNFKVLIDPDSGSKALPNPNMVGDAMTYKCNEWYHQGIKELANPATTTSGISKIREGCRQCYKQYNNYLKPRDLTRAGINGGEIIPKEFHKYMEILHNMNVNKGGSVVKAKKELEALGTTFEAVFQQLGDLMRQVG